MGLLESVITATRFKDTVFYKENSDLQARYDALKRLVAEFPNNEKLRFEAFIIKKGLDGENEIAYQLKKSSIGMYVLRDVKVKFEDLTAQIDCIIITPLYTYYIECKNLIGNITVNDRGDFIREFTINGRTVKKGFYSPLRQVEAQREVIRKIWERNTSTIKKLIASKDFNNYRRVLVVAANHDTVLDTSRAPKDVKYKVLRADSLIRQIEYDLSHKPSDELAIRTRKDMERMAQWYIDLSVKDEIDFYDYYKNKFCNGAIPQKRDDLRERLVKLRKDRSIKMNIPPYYVFSNDELEALIKMRPKTILELERSNILSPIKIKTHGREIIDAINR